MIRYLLLAAAMLSYSNAFGVNVITSPGDRVSGGKLVTVRADLPAGSCQWIMITEGISYHVQDCTVFIATPCHDVRIRMICFGVDWDNQQFVDQQEVMIEVDGDCDGPDPGPGPEPDPDPDPDPDPEPDPSRPTDPEFDGLAGRIWDQSRQVTDAQRTEAKIALLTAAQKLDDHVFVRISDARQYVANNWPVCNDDECQKLLQFIAKDGSTRQLSIADGIRYYRTVAKGLVK